MEHTKRAGGAPRRRERTKVGFTLTSNFRPFEVISADIQRTRRDLFTSFFQTWNLRLIQFKSAKLRQFEFEIIQPAPI